MIRNGGCDSFGFGVVVEDSKWSTLASFFVFVHFSKLRLSDSGLGSRL